METQESGKKFYKRWWFWVVVVIVLFIIIGASSGGSKPTASVPAPSETGRTVAPTQTVEMGISTI